MQASHAAMSTAERVIREYERMKGARVNWDSYWEDLAEYFLPNKDNVYGYKLEGERKFNRLYDSTSVHALEMLASSLHGMLTNPASVWFGLATGISELDQDKDVIRYTQECTRILIETLNQSNFQEEIHETYLDLGGIGTTVLEIEEDEVYDVRFRSRTIYSSYVAENAQGIIDTLYRCTEMTLRQIREKYGMEAFLADNDLHQKLLDKPDECKEEVIYCVRPNPKLKGKFEGIHVLRKTKFELRSDTFHSWPFAVPRWTKLNEEVYGRSPSMKCLPDVKMLNAVMKTTIRGMQKVVDPPLMVPDNGFLLPINTTPGGTNFYRTGMKDRIEPFPVTARPDMGLDFVNNIRERIRENFFYDQLQLIQQRDMTATEVMQRTDERLRFLGPVLGRLNNELLRPIIDRVFDILERRGKFPKPPQILQDRPNLKIIYTSQIAKAQRTGEANTLVKVLNATPIIQAQPDVIDNINGDQVLRINAARFGLEHEMLRSKDEVAEIRKNRAEANRQAMMAQQENMQADTNMKQAKANQGG